MKRTLVAALAVMLVLASVAPFLAVGSATAAPAGMATIPDGNVAEEVPDGETLALSASELEGGVMASDHAESLEVVLTTADHAPSVMGGDAATVSGNGMAVVLRDDQNSASREVAIDAGQLQEALGYRPEAIRGTHEDGSKWTRSAEYNDGYLVFEVPHFSSNTVTFSGRISLSGTPSDRTQYQYSIQDNATVDDFSVDITGVTNTEWDNVSATGLSDGDTLSTDIAGSVDPGGPSGEPAVRFTGAGPVENKSGVGYVAGTETAFTTTGNLQPENEQLSVTIPEQYGARSTPIDNYVGDNNGGSLSWNLAESKAPGYVSSWQIDTSYPDNVGSATLYIEGQEVQHKTSNFGSGFSGSIDEPVKVNGDLNIKIEGTGSSSSWTLKIELESADNNVGARFWAAPDKETGLNSFSVNKNGGTLRSESTIAAGDTFEYTPDITSPGAVNGSVSGGGLAVIDYQYTARNKTESPSISYGTTTGYDGNLKPSETVTVAAPSLSTSDDTVTVNTNSGLVDTEVLIKEKTQTDSPQLEVNGNTVGTDLTLADGETRSYTIPNEWVTDETNMVNVSMDGSVSADAPDLVYELNYSHTATKRQSIDYTSGSFESTFNASTTYADDTTDAKITFPFRGEVVGMQSVEYRINDESWSEVSAENYRVRDNTTLVTYLSDASGGSLSAGDTIEVRATARKIEVSNGEISVSDITKPGSKLDTQLTVESRSQGFAVNVGPTKNGERVHYAYSTVYPTEDYVIIEANGDQRLYLPNSKTGDTFRVTHVDTRVVAEQGDVRIDVVKAGSNPELDVSPGPGGSGDPVTVEYYNTESGITYLLNSLTRSIVVDSDVAQSPAIFEDDDSDETWTILRDDGATSGGDSGGGGTVGQFRDAAAGTVGSFSLPIDGAGLGQLALVGVLGLGVVLVARRFNPFGDSSSSTSTTPSSSSGSSSNTVSNAAESANGLARTSVAVGTSLSKVAGRGLLTGLQRGLGYLGNVVSVILGNRRASIAAGVIAAIVSARVGLFQLPEGTGILIVVSGVPLATWLIMRRSDAVSRRVWLASTIAATILGLEFVAPGTVQTAIEQLTSEQVAPLLILVAAGGLYLWYRARQSDRPQIIIGGNNE